MSARVDGRPGQPAQGEVMVVKRTAWLLGSLGFVVACGSSAITHRYVDTELGYTEAYGAPRNTRYAATAEAKREYIRITAYERSECDKLRMKVIRRVDQAVKGDKVISQEPPQQLQIAAGKDGVVPCNERWARDVWVALRIRDQTYRIGMPNGRGEVEANLSGELKQSLYGDPAPSEATVVVNGVDAGTVSLASYTSHEARIAALLEDFRAILNKEAADITKEDITRSYELYEQLVHLDSGDDARIEALRIRFLELVYQRKQEDATANLKRNIAALNEAKNLLPAVAMGAIPPYVAAAIHGGIVSPEALLWARGEAALALHHHPALCGPTPFTWNSLGAPDYLTQTRLAFSYLHFAYGDPYQAELRGLCGRMK
jgi:hypothetical protein